MARFGVDLRTLLPGRCHRPRHLEALAVVQASGPLHLAQCHDGIVRGNRDVDPRRRALEQIVAQSGLPSEEVEARFAAGYTVIFDGRSPTWTTQTQRT